MTAMTPPLTSSSNSGQERFRARLLELKSVRGETELEKVERDEDGNKEIEDDSEKESKDRNVIQGSLI